MRLLVFLLVLATLCVYTQNTYKIHTKGIASWYGKEFQGKIMANGEPYNRYALTCASNYYPLGTRLIVRHGHNIVVVRVTDRGPNVKGRFIDVSETAAKFLGIHEAGLGEVEIEEVIVSEEKQ